MFDKGSSSGISPTAIFSAGDSLRSIFRAYATLQQNYQKRSKHMKKAEKKRSNCANFVSTGTSTTGRSSSSG